MARGCAQLYGRDYNEVFSTRCKVRNDKILLAMAAEKGWTVSHMDVNIAYLNSELKEDIYLLLPKGIPGSNNKQKVWKLRKAIYGLKQSGRE